MEHGCPCKCLGSGGDRLRTLEVRIRGHHDAAAALSKLDEQLAEADKLIFHILGGIGEPKD
jgi:hypothetical protein